MAERVVLLHGIARTAASMRPVERALRDAGYATLNVDYRSRARPLSGLVDEVHGPIAAFAAEGETHFVTHSMGGLLARAYLARHRPALLGRVVMLGPPNDGSEIADLVGALWPYRWFFGPAGAELGTRRSAPLTALLGRVDYELGVIAADRPVDVMAWCVLPKPNDGRVTVERTRVAGMTDHIVVHATHGFMTRNPAVLRQTLAFLRNGRFDRLGAAASNAG